MPTASKRIRNEGKVVPGGEALSWRQGGGRFVRAAVNSRIKELIPFGQPKGCERFLVRIISRRARRTKRVCRWRRRWWWGAGVASRKARANDGRE